MGECFSVCLCGEDTELGENADTPQMEVGQVLAAATTEDESVLHLTRPSVHTLRLLNSLPGAGDAGQCYRPGTCPPLAGVRTWHRHLLGLTCSQMIRSSIVSPAPASTSMHTPISQPQYVSIFAHPFQLTRALCLLTTNVY